jgi:4-amino-4-deoxy-L-arabinose transferase-like glycosyltransferase
VNTKPAAQLESARWIVQLVMASAVVALVVWTLFYELGKGALEDWDEAIYGQVAWEMVQHGDWLTPSWNGHHFFETPPVMFWLMALAFKVGTPPELAVRLMPAIFGLLTIGFTAWLGRAILSRWVAVTAALLLVAANSHESMNFVVLARQGMLDVPFTAMMVWALLHFWLGFRDSRHWQLLGLPLGVAVMIRSISAATIVVIILLNIIFFPWLGERLHRQQWRAVGIGVLMAAAIALPWHILQVVWHGTGFLHDYGLLHFMKLSRMESDHRADWTYYVSILKLALPYWFWFVLPAVGLGIGRLVYAQDRRALLLLVWAGVIFALHTLAATKLPWYILPMYPALALLVAWFLQELIPRHAFVQEIGAVLLLLAIATWNFHTISPGNGCWACKSLGQCLATVTSADETIAFFDPSQIAYVPNRPNMNIRPTVRFYANRPMIAFRHRPAVERWLAEGGRFLWTDSESARQIEDLFVVIGREADQQLLRRANWADAPLILGHPCHE